MTQSFGDELFRKLLGETTKKETERLGVGRASEDVKAVIRYRSPTRHTPIQNPQTSTQ